MQRENENRQSDRIGAVKTFGGMAKRFLLPSLTPAYVLRLLGVTLVAFLFFRQICLPMWIDGKSMEPTYSDGSFLFCWRPASWFGRKPDRGDVVVIRFAGVRVMMLKRVVAVAGETVEFRGGKLLVNGETIAEPYLRFPCDWELPVRIVEPGNVYVVGDNRGVPIDTHHFGQTPVNRIVGVPLW
jgi:signal peptidase I